MITDERMHDLFHQVLPEREPGMPDLAPAARRAGRRLRHRSRLRVGVTAIAVATLAGGAVVAVDFGPGRAHETSAAASEAEVRLFTAIRNALPPDTASARPLPGSDFPALRVVSAQGEVSTIIVGRPRPAFPEASYSCGTPGTPCDWRALPDGSRAASGHAAREDGAETSWLDILTPDRRHISMSATNSEGGSAHSPNPPLTAEELIRLASDAKVMAALRGLSAKPSAQDEQDRARFGSDPECRYVLDNGTWTLVCPPGVPLTS
jgi:hypothetical protein